MNNTGSSPEKQLRNYFDEVAPTARMAGMRVLRKLSDLASASINGRSTAQDAVAFALSQLLALHSEDLDERPVTGDDAYRLMASGGEHLSEAIDFIEQGGSSENAAQIIAALARLTPDRLSGRWPPDLGETAT
jgi:hypothetical protein